MGQYVGLDVSLDETKVHVLDDQGKRVGAAPVSAIPRQSRRRSAGMLPRSCGSGWRLGPDDLAVAAIRR